MAAEKDSDERKTSTAPVPALFSASLESAQMYLENKVPGAVLAGGVVGFTTGFYIGESAALYTAAYALGSGLGTTALLSGTYALRILRQKDDILNFALSGAVNGAWIVAGLAGRRRAAAGAVVGAAAGVALKSGGDSLYDTSRLAWIRYRKHTMENSKPRKLDVRKPMFRPEDSTISMIRGKSVLPAPDEYVKASGKQ